MAAAHRTGPVPSTPNPPQPPEAPAVLLGPGGDYLRPWPRPDLDVDRERRIVRASAYVHKAHLARADARRRFLDRCVMAVLSLVGVLGTALVAVLVKGGAL